MKNPGYYDVVLKDTGNIETVEVVYDPSKVSYETLQKPFLRYTTLPKQMDRDVNTFLLYS